MSITFAKVKANLRTVWILLWNV